LKVLVSAYACEPGRGSEPYVGWNMPLHLAHYQDVWLLTRANNRQLIEAELRKQPTPHLHVVYFDLPGWAKVWKKGRRGIHLYYYLWQLGVYFVAKRLHRSVRFDIVHHLTFGIDWVPSFLSFLPVPFVWGPLVGAQPVSAAFRRTFSWGARSLEVARSWTRRLSRFDPVMRWAARRTAIALASGLQTRDQLRRLGCRRVITYPSVGISENDVEHLLSIETNDRNGKVRFVCVGNLFAFRAVSLTLHAFRHTRRRFPLVELWIVGDGPERVRLRRQTEELGVGDAVRFWGTIPRHEVLRVLADCDVLVYPCLRGAISMACLEAMAAGLPVICLDLGGAALQVNEESGIKVRAITPEQLAEDLTEAMGQLAEDENLRRRLGCAARRRVRDEFTWRAKALQLCELYRAAVIEHTSS
jgi:glycosyltransferase involved in cell wall biosynthesis